MYPTIPRLSPAVFLLFSHHCRTRLPPSAYIFRRRTFQFPPNSNRPPTRAERYVHRMPAECTRPYPENHLLLPLLLFGHRCRTRLPPSVYLFRRRRSLFLPDFRRPLPSPYRLPTTACRNLPPSPSYHLQTATLLYAVADQLHFLLPPSRTASTFSSPTIHQYHLPFFTHPTPSPI
jgi:hypothetical protein